MSDHIDGPRQVGDPAADLTDLFAFTSPENPARTVLAACVFPSAGTTAMFSNAVDYAFAIRRVTVAGLGDAAKFEPGEEEIGSVAVSTISNAALPGPARSRAERAFFPTVEPSPSASMTKKGHQRRTASSAYSPACAQTHFTWRGLFQA